jgi:hypothetical protein
MSVVSEKQPDGVTAEMQLLLDCVRSSEGALDASGVDGNAFIRLARAHRCIPRVQARLMPCPLPLGESLKQLATKVGLCNTVLTEALFRIQHVLDKNRIPVTCVKGPALSLLAYGNIAARQFGDLDLVVSCRDLFRTAELLLSQGYTLRRLSIPANLRRYVSAQRCVTMQNTEQTVYLDVASTLVSHALSTCDMAEEVLTASTPLRVDGDRQVYAPGPECMMVIVCIHGAQEMWDKLYMVGDVAALLESHPDADWGAALEMARTWGHGRSVRVGMALARQVLGVTLPEVAAQALSHDAVSSGLANEAAASLLSGRSLDIGLGAKHRFAWRNLDRTGARCRWFLRTAFVPGAWELNRIVLPRGFGFLYYALRPFRMLGRMPRLRHGPRTG